MYCFFRTTPRSRFLAGAVFALASMALSTLLARSAVAATRPSYNRGVGFFVLGGKLYDANGAEFRIRGVNKLHWDNPSRGLAKSHANTVRWNIDFTRPASSNVSLILGTVPQGPSGTVADKMVVMPGNWNGTCLSDAASLAAIVDTWVSQAATWNKPFFEK